MKKIILTLAIAVSSFAAFAGEEKVNPKVLDAFKNEFITAKEVIWTTGDNYYMASFEYNENHMFAYYGTEGDLLGITRYISPVNLPVSLQISLKKYGNSHWVSDLFEVSKNQTTAYYITLENADTKLVLKSSGGSDWEVFKTVKKS